MRYAVVIEEGARGFGAYVPDLPACVAVAKTRAAVVKLIHGAIEFHIEGLRKGGEPVPKPASSVDGSKSGRSCRGTTSSKVTAVNSRVATRTDGAPPSSR